MDSSASLTTINLALEAARVAGVSRSGLITMAQTLFEKIRVLLEKRNETLLESYPGLGNIAEAVGEYLAATDAINNAHSLVSEIRAVLDYTEVLRPPTRDALVQLAALGAANIPTAILPSPASLPTVVVDPDLLVRTILALDVAASTPEVYDAQLASLTRERLWALHAMVLLLLIKTHKGC